jgi:glycosyltransferase involved in cell wall biosynthesis
MSPVSAAEGPIGAVRQRPSAELSAGLGSLAALIPAWQPDERMVGVVRALVDAGFGWVVVVDDGSHESCARFFAEVAALERVVVLRHAVNLGKGRGLKTGFNHVLNLGKEVLGVVTADADGQHTPEDIVQVGEALLRSGDRAVLGVRTFEGDIPLRSRFGNLLTRRVFAFLTGTKISDTQTGLRGLPRAVLPGLMALDGERYEYEMTMLAHLCRGGPRPLEVPIATIYIENNRGSHFDPVWDSMRIYFVLVRFYASSLLAAGLDLLLFTVCFALTGKVLLSVVVGRLSSLVNFWANRRFVFHSRGPVPAALWRYYLLAIGVGAVSYGLILTLHTYAHWPVLVSKVCVDVLLSLVSFSAQRTFVFRRGEAI